MGNSNSSSSVQVGHHSASSKWPAGDLHSIQMQNAPSDHRNRMKKSYFPPKHYLAHSSHPHSIIVQPAHLVLPKQVNPDELRLKPTSNGAILRNNGTISGRKLMNELDLSAGSRKNNVSRKKSSNSSTSNSTAFDDTGVSGLSTPNLSSLIETHDDDDDDDDDDDGHQPRTQNHKKYNKRRDYESDPDFNRLSSYNSMMVAVDDEPSGDEQKSSISLRLQPNSVTSISESPAKKQIRCKKTQKSLAPPPPCNSGGGPTRTIIGEGIVVESYTKPGEPEQRQPNDVQLMAKKLHRMFKTKDQKKKSNNNKLNGETNQKNESYCGKWELMGMKGQGDDDRPEPQSKSADNDNHRQYNQADFCRKESCTPDSASAQTQTKSSTTTPTPLCSSSSKEHGPGSETGGSSKEQAGAESSSLASSRHDSSRQAISGRASVPVPIKNNLMKTEPSTSSSSSKLGIIDAGSDGNRRQARATENSARTEDGEDQKKKFYFGMEEDSTNTMRIRNHKDSHSTKSSSLTRFEKHANNPPPLVKDKDKSASPNNANKQSSSPNKNLPHSSAADGFQVSIQGRREQESRNQLNGSSTTSHSHHPVKSERVQINNHHHKSSQGGTGERLIHDKSTVTNKMGQRSSQSSHARTESSKDDASRVLSSPTRGPPTTTTTNKHRKHHSGSDSDGNHQRQDSGNFDDFNEQSHRDESDKKRRHANTAIHGTIHESSSDLSSSEMDIPLLLRPTLPQKRQQLPRFSPASAWRALDSPPVSGRSLSSEEGGFHYVEDGGVQRYSSRAIAPPRHGGVAHERSGDSGISAGDNSPAIPEMVIPSPGKSYSSGKKELRRASSSSSSPDGPTKCWTPEQDLDESSSEFDETEMTTVCVPNSSSSSSNVILNSPNGPRTPPKLTTKKNFFSSTTASASAMLNNNLNNSDSESTNGRLLQSNEQSKQALYTRSTKIKQQYSMNNNSHCVNPDNNADFSEYSKPSLRRIANHHKFHRKSTATAASHHRNNDEFLGLDTNWFLSRSEPNSLNNLRMMMMTSEPLDFILHKAGDPSSQNRRGEANFKFCTKKRGRGDGDDNEESENENDDDDGRGFGGGNSLGEVQSDIGYGPTSLNNYYYYHSLSDGHHRAKHPDEDEFGLLKRPFSQHIMYLPSYDSRRLYPSSSVHAGSSSRRAKSVDNLDSGNVLFKSSSCVSSNGRSRFDDGPRHSSHTSDNDAAAAEARPRVDKSKLKVDEGPIHLINANNANANFAEQVKRKKFKFQSTLRVLERKQIERQLAQEATEKEMERLREIEDMKRVEEEFQKKRAKEKLDVQNGQQQRSNDNKTNKKKMDEDVVTITPWTMNQRTVISKEASPIAVLPTNQVVVKSSINNGHHTPKLCSGGTTVLSINNGHSIVNTKQPVSHKCSSSSSSNGSSSTGLVPAERGKSRHDGATRISNINLNQRMEPEGAPSSSCAASVNDLRRELIHASRKRNGTNSSLSSSTDPLSTQELSEYRQETRQYWDYCRKSPRPGRHVYQHSSSVVLPSNSSRHGDSSSDIYPVSSKGSHDKGKGRFRSTVTTIHPEVVCDIPARPLSYNRLSGSTSNILDDRSSLVGLSHSGSGPSSVISDNYRRDWVHKNPGSSVIHIMGPAKRASSIVSLHSAPGYTSSSDNFRHSNTDLSVNNTNNHHHVHHQQQHNNHSTSTDYMMGSPESTPTRRKSPTSQKFVHSPPSQSSMIVGPAKSSRTSTNSNGHISMDHSSSIFQPQPFSTNKTKEYRPVVFKPSSSSNAYQQHHHQMNSLS